MPGCVSARSRTYRGESAYSGCLKTLRVSYGLARYELLWANEPAQLSAAEKTLCHAKFEMDSLRTQIAQAALLLKALPAMPTLPSLVFRRPGAADAECVPIGTGVSVGRGENCEIRFEKSKEPSRAHFSVLPFERASSSRISAHRTARA